LHGSPGSDTDWARLSAPAIAAEAFSAGRLPPTVLVFPDGAGPRGGAEDHWADDYVPGDRMESDLLDDLIPAVESHFRVVADGAHRAVGGLSSGGYGAANLALRHPGEFSLALVFTGDLSPEPTAFGANQPEIVANDPLELALEPKPSDASAFFVGWGLSDGLRDENSRFAAELRAGGYTVTSDAVPGGHSADVWRQLLLASLDSMGEHVAPPVRH
jgi:enterochelin esterase-like enzyme